MIRTDHGTMTVEAAILFPAFLTIILLFLMLLRLVVLETAIQSAANETVKQLSAAISPFEVQLSNAGEKIDKLQAEQLDFLPETVRQWLISLDEVEELPYAAMQSALRSSLKPIVWSAVPQSIRGVLLKEEQLSVQNATLPYLTGNRQMVSVEVRYDVRISLPFFQRHISIVKQAKERVWFGA